MYVIGKYIGPVDNELFEIIIDSFLYKEFVINGTEGMYR